MATPIKQIKTSDDVIHGIQATGILYGECDSTSTSTAFTAQVPGVSEYYDGLTILLRNGVVTSASGFTININGLGGKPSYSNMTTGNDVTPTAPTRDTTVFNINYTMLITYSSDIVEGGGWIMYRGYDTNTNTIGYQLRTNSQTMATSSAMYRYRMLFTSADGKKYVPSNASSSTSETASKTVTTTPIDPFGSIFYYGRTNTVSSGSKPSAAYLWQQYTVPLGYAFNRTGATLTMTTSAPVYVKCAPQADGSAIIDASTPIVQALPSSEDGKIYIFLGVATSATQIELEMNHPVYYYKDGAIREWTNQTDTDISGLAPLASPNFTGTPTAPTPSETAGNTTVVNKGYVTDAITTAISGVTQFDYAVTSTLPNSGVKGTIYLVPHTHGTQDIYDEYIYANNVWEKIGNTDVDLDDYATKTFVTTTLVNDGIKVIDLGNQTIPVSGGMGQLTVSSDVSSEIDTDFQNKNLALRVHYSGDIDTPDAHVIVFNIGNIIYQGMTFHGFQGSYTLSNLQIYECFVGIGYGTYTGVNLIGVIEQSTARSASITNDDISYYGVSHMSSGIADLYDGSDMYYPITQFDSVLVYDVGAIPITQAELTSLSSGISVSKTISLPYDTWNNIRSLHYNPGVALTSHITLNGVELSRYSLLNEGDLTNGGKQFSGVVAINGSSMIFALFTVHPTDNTQNTWVLKPIPSVGDLPYVPTYVSAFTNDANYITSSDIPTNVSSFNNDANYIASGDNISELNNDVGYVTASDIPSITAVASLTTGVTIGSIDIDGNTTTFYAPAQVQVDWNSTSGISSILNRPSIPTAASFTSTYDSRYKKVQTAVTGNPTVSGTTDTFITNVTQDAQGVLTRVAASLPLATSSNAGITKVGASGGAAAYSHTHSTSDITGISNYVTADDLALSTSADTFVKSYPGVTSRLTTQQIYPAANVTAVTGIVASTTSLYPAANVTAVTGVVATTTSLYPAANITALTSVTSSTTSIYPAADVTALTTVTGTTTLVYGTGTATVYGTGTATVYGSGTISNVMSAPTVVNDVLSFTLVTTSNGSAVTVSNGTSITVANGTAATVVKSISSSGKSVRGTATTVVNAVTVPDGKPIRDSARTVATGEVTLQTASVRDTAVNVAAGNITLQTASVRDSAVTVATGAVATNSTGASILTGLGTPTTGVAITGATYSIISSLPNARGVDF